MLLNLCQLRLKKQKFGQQVAATTAVELNTGLTRPVPVKVVPLDRNMSSAFAALKAVPAKLLSVQADAADQLLSVPFEDPVDEIKYSIPLVRPPVTAEEPKSVSACLYV